MVDGSSIRAAVREYLDYGMDPIPLTPGTKDAFLHNWQSKDPFRLWSLAPENANVGIRAGGDSQSAFLDCDEIKHPGTYVTIQSWLSGLGYLPDDYPLVRTPSIIGRHIYVRFAGGLAGDYRNFSPAIGSGEFRYGPGAYVAAPPSILQNGNGYVFIGGDLRQRPILALDDIKDILSNQELTPYHSYKLITIPRRAKALLHGSNIEIYPSRSEAEQALIVTLINAGHDFNSILELFCSNPCAGKFAELRAKSERSAICWLRHSYDEAVKWAASHESKIRQELLNLIQWASVTPWPGRTGAVDRAVFLAHAMIAYNAGRLIYAASVRDLGVRAGVSRMTAARANHRLCKNQLLEIEVPSTVDCANIFRMQINGHNVTLPHNRVIRECHVMSADAFRRKGLGKSSAEVWSALQYGPMTVKELVDVTGRCSKTIKRVLANMANLADTVTGELIPMVGVVGEKWYACDDVDLEHVAEVVRTTGMSERQREQHQQERRVHRRRLLKGKM